MKKKRLPPIIKKRRKNLTGDRETEGSLQNDFKAWKVNKGGIGSQDEFNSTAATPSKGEGKTFECFGIQHWYDEKKSSEQKQREILLSKPSTMVILPGGNVCGWLLRIEIRPGSSFWTPWYFVLDPVIHLFAVYQNQYRNNGTTETFNMKNASVKLTGRQKFNDIYVYSFLLHMIEPQIQENNTLYLGTTDINLTTNWIKMLRKCCQKRPPKRKNTIHLLNSIPWADAPVRKLPKIALDNIVKEYEYVNGRYVEFDRKKLNTDSESQTQGENITRKKKVQIPNTQHFGISTQNITKQFRKRNRQSKWTLSKRPISRAKEIGVYDLLKTCRIRYQLTMWKDGSLNWDLTLTKNEQYAAIKIQACCRQWQSRLKFSAVRENHRESLRRKRESQLLSAHFRRLQLYCPKLLNKVSIRIQSLMRGFLTRKHLVDLKNKSRIIQNIYRERLKYRMISAIKIQCVLRGTIGRAKAKEKKQCVRLFSLWWWTSILSSGVAERVIAAICIQNLYRQRLVRVMIVRGVHSLVVIQSLIRKHLKLKKYQQLKSAALQLQSRFRAFYELKTRAERAAAGERLTSFMRLLLQRQRLQKKGWAVRVISSIQLSYICKRRFQISRKSAIIIQSWFRSVSQKNRFVHVLRSLKRLQARHRMHIIRSHYLLMKSSARKIKIFVKKHTTRLRCICVKWSISILFRFLLRFVITPRRVRLTKLCVCCQSRFRGLLCRRKYKILQLKARFASTKIQAIFRGSHLREIHRNKLHHSVIYNDYVNQTITGEYPTFRFCMKTKGYSFFVTLKRSQADANLCLRGLVNVHNHLQANSTTLYLGRVFQETFTSEFILALVSTKSGNRDIFSVAKHLLKLIAFNPLKIHHLLKKVNNTADIKLDISFTSTQFMKHIFSSVIARSASAYNKMVSQLSMKTKGNRSHIQDFRKYLTDVKSRNHKSTIPDTIQHAWEPKKVFDLWQMMHNLHNTFQSDILDDNSNEETRRSMRLQLKPFINKLGKQIKTSRKNNQSRKVEDLLECLLGWSKKMYEFGNGNGNSIVKFFFLCIERTEKLLFYKHLFKVYANFLKMQPTPYMFEGLFPGLTSYSLREGQDRRNVLESKERNRFCLQLIENKLDIWKTSIKEYNLEKKSQLIHKAVTANKEIQFHASVIEAQAVALGDDIYYLIENMAELKKEQMNLQDEIHHDFKRLHYLNQNKSGLVDNLLLNWGSTRIRQKQEKNDHYTTRIMLTKQRYDLTVRTKNTLEYNFKEIMAQKQYFTRFLGLIHYVVYFMQAEASFASKHGPIRMSNITLKNKEQIMATIMQEIAAYAGRHKRYLSSCSREAKYSETIPLKDLGYLDSASLKENMYLELQYARAMISSWNHQYFDNLIAHVQSIITQFEQMLTEFNHLVEETSHRWNEHEQKSTDITNNLMQSTRIYEDANSKHIREINLILEKLHKARQNPKNFWWYKYVNSQVPINSYYDGNRVYLSKKSSKTYYNNNYEIRKVDYERRCTINDTNQNYNIDDADIETCHSDSSIIEHSVRSLDSSEEDAPSIINRIKESAGLIGTSKLSRKDEVASLQTPKIKKTSMWAQVLRIVGSLRQENSKWYRGSGLQPVVNENVQARKIQRFFRKYYQNMLLRRKEESLRLKVICCVCRIQALIRRTLVMKTISQLLCNTYDLVMDPDFMIPFYYNLNNGVATWDIPRMFSRYNVNLEPSMKGMYKTTLVIHNIRPSIDLISFDSKERK